MSAGAALVGVLCVGLDCHSMQGGKYFYCYMVQAEAMNTPPPRTPQQEPDVAHGVVMHMCNSSVSVLGAHCSLDCHSTLGGIGPIPTGAGSNCPISSAMCYTKASVHATMSASQHPH
jgi:hypothetical protein